MGRARMRIRVEGASRCGPPFVLSETDLCYRCRGPPPTVTILVLVNEFFPPLPHQLWAAPSLSLVLLSQRDEAFFFAASGSHFPKDPACRISLVRRGSRISGRPDYATVRTPKSPFLPHYSAPATFSSRKCGVEGQHRSGTPLFFRFFPDELPLLSPLYAAHHIFLHGRT